MVGREFDVKLKGEVRNMIIVFPSYDILSDVICIVKALQEDVSIMTNQPDMSSMINDCRHI